MGVSLSTRRTTGYGSGMKGPIWQELSDGTFQQITNDDGDLIAPVDTPDLMFSNGEAIEDNNGNEIIKVAVVSSAVNEVTIANAATGNSPRIGATGGDTNLDLGLGGKGTGVVRFDGGAVPATATASGGAATASAQCAIITSESLTTAAGSDYTLTLTNAKIASTSLVLAQVGLGTSTQGVPLMYKVTPGSGSVTIVIKNIHASLAFNGTIIVRVVVL